MTVWISTHFLTSLLEAPLKLVFYQSSKTRHRNTKEKVAKPPSPLLIYENSFKIGVFSRFSQLPLPA